MAGCDSFGSKILGVSLPQTNYPYQRPFYFRYAGIDRIHQLLLLTAYYIIWRATSIVQERLILII